MRRYFSHTRTKKLALLKVHTKTVSLLQSAWSKKLNDEKAEGSIN